MVRKPLALIFLLFTMLAGCQNERISDEEMSILVGPYLQTATPTSINIMWESAEASPCRVEWGVSTYLQNRSTGFDIESRTILDQYKDIIPRRYTESVIHHVQLTDLDPDTRYYYRVITGDLASDVYDFRTPPAEDSDKSFTFIVIGDSRTAPKNLSKVVHDGIITFAQSMLPDGSTLSDALALVFCLGDIVTDGAVYDEYRVEWFEPIHPLSAQVPFYVAIGNHEYTFSDPAGILPDGNSEENAEAFFAYLELPGDENRYSFNYSNTHFIALNTNGPTSNAMCSYGSGFEEQLAWLEKDLSSTASDPNIDFIFAFHHHPYKTELWNRGESRGCTTRVGEFVKLYEKYGVNAYFYAHTHAMERGNSRDKPLYWVLSGGGGCELSNWYGPSTAEGISFDHPEIQKSIDEHGFHIVAVKAGDNPEFTITYVSLGDLDNREQKNAEVVDQFTFIKNNAPPEKPSPVFPLSADWPDPENIRFQASSFSDRDQVQDPLTGLWSGDYHHETQWQITTEPGNYPEPYPVPVFPPQLPVPAFPVVVDSWVRFENFYGEIKPIEKETLLPGTPIDTRAGDDLTDEIISLDPDTTYYWRLRYRDGRGLAWSEWSDEMTFTTAP